MKTRNIILGIALMVGVSACSKKDFEDNYTDPSKIGTTTVEKQYSGFLQSNWDYVVPNYWNYFVILRTSLQHYNQTVGWANGANQYVTGAASITDRWKSYYGSLAQYKELLKVYNASTADDQELRRIYYITATIYLYDHTQRTIDLHGDIPFTGAGLLSTNGGNYAQSYAPYDDAAAIYTKMLDDLKAFSTELNTIQPIAAIQSSFKTQDFINGGNIATWAKYCNSLRLRMLTRVSAASAFSSRASSEIAEILGSPATYPVVTTNADNILMDVKDLNTQINAKGFRDGLESWNGNAAGKKMIDFLVSNADPRLPVMFETTVANPAIYVGVDPMGLSNEQQLDMDNGRISLYNRSTFSRNQYFPGVLMTASEVNLLAAEYYVKTGDNAKAKAAYETAIRQSTEFYYSVRALSNDGTVDAPATPTEGQITTYLASPGASWDLATTNDTKLNLIATQKWLHFNVIQPYELYAEVRRLDKPSFTFQVDNANSLKQPPTRWQYPAEEATYNNANYSTVQSKDIPTGKLFWDVN
ncbi:MAG: SusD/RagB family nutrient-binding outer membrane lipoprotein [Bacteroidetes bacterium]|nr:SusD/RagB family nutrient-binding outer membrane lipoprotein [Bacteroidota bacterium]